MTISVLALSRAASCLMGSKRPASASSVQRQASSVKRPASSVQRPASSISVERQALGCALDLGGHCAHKSVQSIVFFTLVSCMGQIDEYNTFQGSWGVGCPARGLSWLHLVS